MEGNTKYSPLALLGIPARLLLDVLLCRAVVAMSPCGHCQVAELPAPSMLQELTAPKSRTGPQGAAAQTPVGALIDITQGTLHTTLVAYDSAHNTRYPLSQCDNVIMGGRTC